MKKTLLMFLFVMFFTNFIHAGAFLNNTIVVVRVDMTSNAGKVVFLDEYSTTGTLVQTITLPSATSGSNHGIVLGGSASSEGYHTLSTDQNYLALSGYDGTGGLGAATPSGVAPGTLNRVIALIDQTGTYTCTTALTDAAGATRGVVFNGTSFWQTGATNGTRYVATVGATTSTQLAAANTNQRCANIFNGQYYYSSGSSPNLGVNTYGAGTPSTSGQTATLLTGYSSGTHSCYGFALSPDGNTMYMADDGSVGNGGGIQKWIKTAGVWGTTPTYILAPTVFVGFRGIVVDWTGANPVIYATSNTANGNSIFKVTDTGSGSLPTIIATAATGYAFRGISFTPQTILPVELSSFTSNVNGRDINLNWTTKTEKNSNKFEIERSINQVWTNIGSVKASVLSNSTKQYTYSDKNLNAGKYQYRLKMVDNDGSFKYSSVTEAVVSLPMNFELSQNYPNPFNPSTKINYSLPSDSRVTLEVYNVLGVKVGQLVNQDQSAGYYSVDFNASSRGITSGVYLYKITTLDKATGNSFSAIKKMMMLK